MQPKEVMLASTLMCHCSNPGTVRDVIGFCSQWKRYIPASLRRKNSSAAPENSEQKSKQLSSCLPDAPWPPPLPPLGLRAVLFFYEPVSRAP